MTDSNTTYNNIRNEEREKRFASHQEQLVASFEGMGLMGGTAPVISVTTSTKTNTEETTSSSTPHNSTVVAPPPASAPPLPPPDSPVKHVYQHQQQQQQQQQQLMMPNDIGGVTTTVSMNDTGTSTTSGTTNTNMTGIITTSSETNGDPYFNNNTNSSTSKSNVEKERHISNLMDSLTGSLSNLNNHHPNALEGGGSSLFGDDNDHDNDGEFINDFDTANGIQEGRQSQQQQQQQAVVVQSKKSYDSSFSNNYTGSSSAEYDNEDETEGTLISDAAIFSNSSMNNNNNNSSSSNNNNNSNHRRNIASQQKPSLSMSPSESLQQQQATVSNSSSFYRNHDEALSYANKNNKINGSSTCTTNNNNGQRRLAQQQQHQQNNNKQHSSSTSVVTSPTPVVSTTLRRDRSNSNHSLGSTTSTLTANTSSFVTTTAVPATAAVAQLPIKGTSNSNVTSKKNQKPKAPFVIPDYILQFKPMFSKVSVGDPRQVSVGGITNILASVASGGITTKYWVYIVSSTTSTVGGGGGQDSSSGKTLHVQRRFRHFDALQERLREACPGAILPSRPAKHSVRAIEEGSTNQSAAFVSQRAKELHNYLNALIVHPIAGNSEPLQFFLTFLDTDLGTAWPEVSNSALTRFTVGVTKTAANATGTSTTGGTGGGGGGGGGVHTSPQHNGPNISLSFDHMGGGGGQTIAAAAAARAMDDNSDLIELSTNESHRINLIHQSIPQVESFLVKLSDYQETQVSLAMECAKLSKLMGNEDRPLILSTDILSNGLLRTSRRTKRSISESYAALDTLLQEPRLCRMEKLAFQDRRESFIMWWNLRQQAEHKSSKVVTMRQNGIAVQLHKFEAEAAHFIHLMDDAYDRVNDISTVLQSEVIRLKKLRQIEWMKGLKIWTCSQKETYGELTSIWHDIKANHERIFANDGEDVDDDDDNNNDNVNVGE